ncbi:MAG TPA: TadG family pilus assembly protein [Thermohalobaculum sp.]|nr:TadG family pilus assembly protein [Thermohalobaculum sp.]
MLFQRVSRFIRDEDGSYTLWSLAWFMLYVGIGGLAVDATDVYRHQNFLQATADSASLAGVMSLSDPDEATNYALAFAENNMRRNVHGTVLTESEVQLGYWDTGARKFYPNEPNRNAVYVTTRRGETNQNPLGMIMLRFFGLVGLNPWWNVNAEAVAIRYYPDCLRGGFIAEGQVWFQNNNHFYNNICVHGQVGGVGHKGAVQGNTYESGVAISMGHPDGNHFSGQALQAEDLQAALANGGINELWPAEAYEAADYIEMLRQMPDTSHNTMMTTADGKYESWEFMYPVVDAVRVPPARATSQPAGDAYLPFHVYELMNCNGQLSIGSGAILANVTIVTSCRIHIAADMSAGNVILASTYTGPQPAVSVAAQAKLGNSDYCDTGTGGVQIYTLGDAHLAAQTDWHGVRVAAAGDVGLAAQNSVHGVSVQAGGDIDFQSNGEYGLCPNIADSGPVEWRYRLVQ